MPPGDTFYWIGGTTGAWNSVTNWSDLTTGTVATTVPGIADTATIGGTVTLSGTASVGSLDITGSLDVAGTVTGVDITLGGTNSVTGGLYVAGALDVQQPLLQTILAAPREYTFSSSLSGGTITDNLVVNPGSPANVGVVLGSLFQGTGHGPGLLNVGSGETVSWNGEVAYTYHQSDYVSFPVPRLSYDPSAPFEVTNDGTIYGANLTLGQRSAGYSGVAHYNSRGMEYWVGNFFSTLGTLGGEGTIIVASGSVANIYADLTGPQTFVLEGSTSLYLHGNTGPGSVDPNTDIILSGTSDTVSGLVPNTTIQGFGVGDTIETIVNFLTSSALNAGVLSLNGGAESVVLPGDFSNDVFLLNGDTITLAPAQSFSWIGGTAGAWGTASDWWDLAAGTVAAVAPGVNALVTIGGTAAVTISGSDAIAQLDVTGSLDLTGSLYAQLLIGSGQIAVSGTATVLTATIQSGQALSIDPDATFQAGAIDNYGTILGGNFQVGSIENTGTIVSGDFEAGAIDNNGKIVGTDFQIGPTDAVSQTLSGSGVVEIAAGGSAELNADMTSGTVLLDMGSTLDLTGPFWWGATIDMGGSPSTLEFSGRQVTYGWLPDNVFGTIYGFQAQDAANFDSGDAIVVPGLSITAAAWSDGTLTVDTTSGLMPSFTLAVAGDYSGDVFIASGDSVVAEAEAIPCFLEGTRILTADGPVPVESLREGDIVVTVSGRPQPIRWIGRRSVDCRRHADPERVLPVRISRHAFGADRPNRTLFLSPDHSVYVEDVLIPIKFLINDTTVAQIPAGVVTYYHLELDRHDVVLAENLPTETYLETGGRAAFENSGLPPRLHPDFTPDDARATMVWRNFSYAPLIGSQERLDRVQAMLACQAIMLGVAA